MSEIPKTMDYWVAEQIIAAHKAGEHKGVGLERERIIKLLEDSFYPLDYPRWQADELMDEIFRLIKGEQ